MPPRTGYRFLLALALLTGLAGAISMMARTSIAGCNAAGYRPGVILVSCMKPFYGDYEQGALVLGLEPRMDAALRAADVVALGDSHAHRALSGEATRLHFAERGRRFFNLSTSGMNSAFADLVLDRVRPRPRVVVVDVDPFFVPAGAVNLPAASTRRLVEQPWRSEAEYLAKWAWQALHRRACPGGPDWFCGTAFSFFRRLDDGGLVIDYRPLFGDPLPRIPVERGGVTDPAVVAVYSAYAQAFLARHGLDPACTIVTVVPSSFGQEWLGRGLAAMVGAPYINPAMDGLTTLDRGHLDDESLERWSAAFWDAARPVTDRCLGKPL